MNTTYIRTKKRNVQKVVFILTNIKKHDAIIINEQNSNEKHRSEGGYDIRIPKTV